jgi:hypothetical protein
MRGDQSHGGIDARVADVLDRLRGGEPALNDAVQWGIDAYTAENKPVNANQVMQDEAFRVAASLHGTTFTAPSVLFDLIDRPESLAEIRAEISRVYAEHGSWTP